MEHYPDAIRYERRQWMMLQGIVLERRGLKEQDWGWLEELEDARWGGGEARTKPLTQREAMERARRGLSPSQN